MKKNQLFILLGVTVIIIGIVGFALILRPKAKISKDEAYDIASKYVNVKKENMNYKNIKKDIDDNSYEIEMQDEFYKYEIEIDANSGRILDYEREPISNSVNKGQDNAKLLTEQEAKEIALTDAKVTEKNAKYMKVELEKDYGTLVYEIEFTVDNVEYEYKVDAHNGNIINYAKEENGTSASKQSNQKYITKEKAKNIALEHSKFTADNVIFQKVEFDYDNDIATYEVEFIHDFTEYDYEIDAVNGNILQFKIDR